MELSSPALRLPHGIDFVDDDTVIVTSRGGDVAVLELPRGEREPRSYEVLPSARWPADGTTHLNAPGSVAVTRGEDGTCEVLICNNNAHTVTRHRLARGAGGAVGHSEVLLQKHLGTPDGVGVSPDRRWIAVSNHAAHNVLLYENSPSLSAVVEPDGILRGVYYPHGLRFTVDGRRLLVADAGAPYLRIFAQDADEWRGVRHPVATVRIMDQAMFERGRHNREEGGPKGLDIDASSNVLVVTSECQPLAFFDLPALLQHADMLGTAREQRALAMTYELYLIGEIREQRDRLAERDRQTRALQSSLSWRLTAPLRRLGSVARRLATLLRGSGLRTRAPRPAGAHPRGSLLP